MSGAVSDAVSDDGRRPVFHGRRRGRRLRPAQAARLDRLLPQLAIDPGGGPIADLQAMFPEPVRDAWLEIGFGAGEHLAAQAAAHRDVGFLGAEAFQNGIVRLLGAVEAQGLRNVRIFPDDARLLLARLPEASIGRCFVLFPDPWPKSRHHERRIVSPPVLEELARVMTGGAELRLASDHMGYIRWMLDHVLRHGAFEWRSRGPADWRERPADWPPTRYEAKARAAGQPCVFLRFRRRERGAR